MPAVRTSILLLAVTALTLVATITFMIIRSPGRLPKTPQPEPVTPPVQGSPHATERRTPEIESSIHFALAPPAVTGLRFEDDVMSGNQPDMAEQNGTGVSIFDYDSDGQADLFFVNGAQFEMPAAHVARPHRLYRGTSALQFKDTTRSGGLEAFGGQGCAAADYDNDGFTDLFVTDYGANRLWHNNGDGTFSDVTPQADVGDESWASSAAFADLDGDGNLDLYVVNYMVWTPAEPNTRFPGPTGYDGLPDLLYRNLGNGRFQELGEDAGISIPVEGNGLALAIGDLNNDRLLDIYVANDATQNFLFRNLGGMRFEEIGIPSGVAHSQDGSIGSGMGVGFSDYNRDGLPDLFVTNFFEEVVDTFTNVGPAGFIANNAELGIDSASRHVLNFGIVLSDFDLDQWPDLFFANGHLWEESGPSGEYKMHPTLLQNVRGTRFIDVSTVAGEYFQRQWLGRAAAMGDLDNDGDTDLVVSHLLAAPAVLENTSDRQGKSQRVILIGTSSSRQPLGCRVEVQLDDGSRVVTEVPSGGSFQVSHDPVLVIPTGTADVMEQISIIWSTGQAETWKTLPREQTIRLVEGTGQKTD